VTADGRTTTPHGAPPRDGAHPTPRDLVPYLLHRATNEVNRAWRERLRPYGLTIQRWQVLSVLAAFDGARITEVAELVAVDQPVVSRVIDQMERDGLVARTADSEDGRVTLVRLTESGRATHADLMPDATRFVDDLTAVMDDGAIGQLAAALTALAESAARTPAATSTNATEDVRHA
jgi:DNA-binding MarR family transcriptional regulator